MTCLSFLQKRRKQVSRILLPEKTSSLRSLALRILTEKKKKAVLTPTTTTTTSLSLRLLMKKKKAVETRMQSGKTSRRYWNAIFSSSEMS